MFVFSNLVFGVARVLDALLNLYFWIVIVSAVLSWVNPDPYNPIVRILRNLTEPVFYRVRKWIPFTYVGGLDLSPVVVLLAIQFINAVLIQSLYQFAMTVR
ncbi:YggT family protein [Nitratidesulfovibrio sp. HK-II]|uniref:YggT family protein n=1 Tax=Nitratidesulfovibrio sp. HK-II TaxID=2009266 RepID=UPI000E2EB8CC|nr:YggT family protein [Nitratidesulfovibrio sp. HK-II]GBO96198.1 integral membrane protein YggT [Nitratidesulfovibrio sp. HK-II]